MSYCRFSCDNWKSDVYCYESEQGFEIHIASKRLVGTPPEVPSLADIAGDSEAARAWSVARRKQHEWLEKAEYRPIGLEHDGESCTMPNLEEFIRKLLYLRSLGYYIPEHAIVLARQEMQS